MREAQPYLDAPQLVVAKAEPSVAPDPRKGRKHIRQDIEHCRVLAAYGVICYHNGGFGSQVGYAGLIIFLILSVYLAGDSAPRSPADRVRRLLTPWLIWFSFYGIIRVLAGKTLLNTQLSPLASVLFGTASHLWYLPYALMVLLFVDQARRLFSPQAVAYVGASMAMLSLAASSVWREPSMLIGYPWAQYAHATPAVFVGLFFMGMNAIPAGVRYVATLGILGTAAFAMNVHGLGIPYLIGVAVCGVLVFAPQRLSDAMGASSPSRLGKYTFGIYLIHPLFLLCVPRLGLQGEWFVPPIVFLLSTISIAAIFRFFPRLARLAA